MASSTTSAAISSNDVGIKISNPGFDAATATGYQLAFNSSWPSIAIAYESFQTVVFAENGSTITFNHNLGFYPFTVAWLTVGGVNIIDFFPGGNGSTNIYQNQVVLNYENVEGIDPTLPIIASVKCYNIDLSTAQSYPYSRPPVTKEPYDRDIGIKVVKQGQDIQSSDLRDFIIHSRGQSPTLLAVVTTGTDSILLPGFGLTDISYTNPTDYVAWIYGYAIEQDDNGVSFYGSVATGGVPSTNGPSLSIQPESTFVLTVTDGGSLLVLKDPMFAPNTINVAY